MTASSVQSMVQATRNTAKGEFLGARGDGEDEEEEFEVRSQELSPRLKARRYHQLLYRLGNGDHTR